MLGLQCIPDGLSTDLTSFSTLRSFFPLSVPLPYITASPAPSHNFPTTSPLHVCLLLCLPFIIMPYSSSSFPLFFASFRPTIYHSLPCCFTPFILHNMKPAHWERLYFTGYQESQFHLPSTSMGTWEGHLTPLQLGQLEETLWGIYTGTLCREQRHKRLISRLLPVNYRELWI